MSKIFPSLKLFCQGLEQKFNQILPSRKQQLLTLSAYLKAQIKENKTPSITFICTHNSRRSHLAQLFLAIATDYYQSPKINTFSGGTEVSAFNPRIVTALRRIGLKITTKNSEIPNPIYEVYWNDQMTPYLTFSKHYMDAPNPQKDFIAVLVCGHADTNCPIVMGSTLRLALPYKDPKVFDNSDLEASEYASSCSLIALEMLFVLKKTHY